MSLYLILFFFSITNVAFTINAQINSDEAGKFEMALGKFFVPINVGLKEDLFSKQYFNKIMKSAIENFLILVPIGFFFNKIANSVFDSLLLKRKIGNLIKEYTINVNTSSEAEEAPFNHCDGFEELKNALSSYVEENKNDGLFYIYGAPGVGKTTAALKLIEYLRTEKEPGKNYRFLNLSAMYQNCSLFELPDGCPGILEQILKESSKKEKTIIFVDELREFLNYSSIKNFLLSHTGAGNKVNLPNHILFIGTGNEHLSTVNHAINDRFFSVKFLLNKQLCLNVLRNSFDKENLIFEKKTINSYLRKMGDDLNEIKETSIKVYNKFNNDDYIGSLVSNLKHICEKHLDKEKENFVFSLRSMDKICQKIKNNVSDGKEIDYQTFKNTLDEYLFNGFIENSENFIKNLQDC